MAPGPSMMMAPGPSMMVAPAPSMMMAPGPTPSPFSSKCKVEGRSVGNYPRVRVSRFKNAKNTPFPEKILSHIAGFNDVTEFY